MPFRASVWLAWVLASLVSLAGSAEAQSEVRVVLASPDAALEGALEAALAPWNVTLVVLDGATLGDSMPGSAEAGAALAASNDAAAVTWISMDEAGQFALWIYDRASGHVAARALPMGPPFDEATADSVALAIKTLLRHSAAAPIEQRLIDPPAPSEVRLELAGGVRALTTSPADAEPRAELAVSYWPAALGAIFGISLGARGGTGIGVHTPTLAARLATFDADLGARVRATLTTLVDLVFSIELGTTVSWLDAALADGTHPTPVSVDATGYTWVELGVRPIAALRIALRAGAFVTTRTRTYLVRGEGALDTVPAAPFGALVFELPLDGGRVDSP